MNPAGQARVLIVEDQKLIAADLEMTLNKLGYEVTASISSGEEAVAAAESTEPDLVLMDIRLRDRMDGIQAAATIRQRVDVPVIFLTAYADEETILRAKVTSPFGYLVKPFNERELRAAIEIALYKHEADRLLAEERARRQAAEEFKRLVESVEDYAIFMLDRKGRITSWNVGAERIKRYSQDEVLGRHFSIFYPPEQVAAGTPDELLRQAARDGRAEAEGWRVRKDGTRFWANCVVTALHDDGGHVEGFAKVTRDLTLRRAAEEAQRIRREEAERVSRLKDEFLATVSHELRTPLNVMLGEIFRLRTGTLQPDQVTKALDSLQRNTRLQVRLVEDLLDTSAVITGKLRLDMRPVDLGGVLREAIDTVRPAANAKHIALRVSFGATVERISGDRDRLQQIFWNVLSNAIKFTPRGGRVDVELDRVGTQVEVRVTDTGIGIAPEFMPRVFQRFSQADATTTREHMGLGLGLALARHFVEAHGGELEAQSAGTGMGSTFTVRFPVPAVLDVSAIVAPPDIRLDGIRVLLVDDQADARASVSAILSMFGAEVATADSVPRALDLLKALKPNVLLADIAMPDQDGYELIRQIRAAEDPELRAIAAAALTAFSSTQDRFRILSAGYHLHMPKPAEPAELAAAVAQLVQNITDSARGSVTAERLDDM